jgi:hypothetical protein
MALTESKIKDLTDKGFDELFKKHKAVWTDLVREARAFAQKNITGNRDPRPDDVEKALYPILEVHEEVRKHQEENKARAPRYVTWFCEYVIDQTLLSKGEQK